MLGHWRVERKRFLHAQQRAPLSSLAIACLLTRLSIRPRISESNRACVRNDLRSHRLDLDADVSARRVRPDRARDDLLESRIQRGSPPLQISWEVLSHPASGYRPPLAVLAAAVPRSGLHVRAQVGGAV